MIPQTDTGRRTNRGAGVHLTTAHRQPRPADPNLVQLDRRITALESRGRMEPARACAVVLLRRSWNHLDRDKATRLAGWHTDAANLERAIERAEATNV